MATAYEVRAGKDGELAVYLLGWNVRVATFEPGVTEADKVQIASLLRNGWGRSAQETEIERLRTRERNSCLENDMEHFNKLTPGEAERLALLAEECGEVIQAIGKVLRHGYESTHPDGGPTNREALERECGDVYHAIWRAIGAGDIDGNGMSQRADDKARSVGRYLHHQGHND